MEGMPYVPGLPAEEPGPLSRFLPPIEDGTVAAWVAEHASPSSWVLDPFGFSPRLLMLELSWPRQKGDTFAPPNQMDITIKKNNMGPKGDVIRTLITKGLRI